MKILFFVQHVGLGGVLRQISILADGLTRKGHEVSVVGLSPQNRDWKMVWDSNLEISMLSTKKSSGALARCVQLLQTARALRRLLRKAKIDILYAYEGDLVRFIAWLATRGLDGARLVWGRQGSASGIRSDHTSWRQSLPSRLSKWVSGSVLLTISNSEAAYAKQKMNGRRRGRQLAIQNGFNVETFKPDPAARKRVRSEWKIADEKLIGIVARLAASKGHGIFLQAASLLLRERDDVRFVIVGDGPDRSRLELLSRELQLAEKLIWTGARQDMAAVYNALDVLCSASIRGEGFSNVIGEAMACGVPCVVTDVGDSAKIVGDLGIVAAPGDSRILAGALAAMLAQLDRIDRGRIRDRIVKRFTLEAMVDATEKALIEIAETRRGSS